MPMTEIQFILALPSTRQAFTNYCTNRHTDETVKCWLACVKYKESPSKTKALALIDQYIVDGAPEFVNLIGKTAAQQVRAQVLAVGAQYRMQQATAVPMDPFQRYVTSGQRKADPNVFNRLIAELELMMGMDTLQDFRRSPAGAAASAQYEEANAAMPSNPALYVKLHAPLREAKAAFQAGS